MKSIGVRELKANLSEILREVDENGQVVEVTRHGRVVARLLPPQAETADRDANGAWTDLQGLAAAISAQWPEGVTAAQAVTDVRREL
ncbi:MAG TPA: type II toxin-antitoxin system Phd/YefM family antitoxin [Chloroflexia bacterium]|jgi:prevent-host-death family protein|nr:type II toxin-antitoxin system Phd/YefM family antitoxin [Chloroflexia bacterium]